MLTQLVETRKWDIFELKLQGPCEGNPFIDITLSACFSCVQATLTVQGFYDGQGCYIIRFMPDQVGTWQYRTSSNCPELNGLSGEFACIKNDPANHGKVKVVNQYHFAYEDGSPFYPFGTTCYAWIHQPQELRDQTLETLSGACYNKLRMCVFPKMYSNNQTEPELYPYEGIAPDRWDKARFNPAFFTRLEELISQLCGMGIEVDLILFHPYDGGHWGFDRMSAEEDERYLRYVIARLGAYRNIWWSIANEYDYMKEKKKADWDRIVEIAAQADPYHHLLSIHQGDVMYDHWKPSITHASIQLGSRNDGIELGFGVYKAHRDVYQKPVIYDEVGYEGNLPQRWGSLTAGELVDKYWKALTSGAYMTHGETFTHPKDIIWWAKGGQLKGQSNARIAFLESVIEQSQTGGLEPLDHWWMLNGAGINGRYYLFYFGSKCFTQWKFELPAFKITPPIERGTKFKVDIIDTWNMTITPVHELYEITDQNQYRYFCNFNPVVELPGRPYMAIRIVKQP